MSRTTAYPTSGLVRAETDPGPRGLVRRLRQATDSPDDCTKAAIVPGNAALQLRQPSSDLRVGDHHPAQSHERAHHEYAHLDGPGAVQDRGGHDRPVLGERPRENRRELEVSEVVTGCDHLGSFGLRELESKVGREAFGVTPDGLIESFSRDPVDQGKIAVSKTFSPRIVSTRDSTAVTASAYVERWVRFIRIVKSHSSYVDPSTGDQQLAARVDPMVALR